MLTAQVQSTIGRSDYERRDGALKGLIQPLAGEYGMHNGQEQGEPLLTCFTDLPIVSAAVILKLLNLRNHCRV